MKTDFSNIKTLQYQVTQNCNSHGCKHCLLWTKDVDGELTYDEFEKFYTSQQQLEHVDITGGEPFLFSGMLNVLRLLDKDKNLHKVSITTNGILEDDVLEAALIANSSKNPSYKFFLSFDGMKDENDYIRGKGSWESSISTLRKLIPLQNPKLKLGISTTINDYNHHVFSDMQKYFLKEFGISLSSINVPNISEFYRNKKNRYTTLAVENLPEHIDYREDTLEYLTVGDTKYQCKSPQRKVVLDSYGNLRGCSMEFTPDFIIGNIRDNGYNLRSTLDNNVDRYINIVERAVKKDCRKCWTPCERSVWDLI